MAERSEQFGRLMRGAVSAIAGFEGKATVAIDTELGEQIKLSYAAIQRYKSGVLPEPGRYDIIEILATAGVKRALLSRAWLQRFLYAARHPAPQDLIGRLVPRESEAADEPWIPHRLPPPTCQFVMRPEPFAAVVEGLRQRPAAVVIVSVGGMGKSSLAREVAAHCVGRSAGAAPPAADPLRFDAVVWVSDKDAPGGTDLAVVLDEIAHTLNHPGIVQLDRAARQRRVEQLLMARRVLLVIDNFETVTDPALLYWLLRLPEPSKAIITTRTYRREFQQGAWLVDLGGMTEEEARQLVAARTQQLKLRPTPGDDERRHLVAITGGSPKAIEMLLGIVKETGQPLADVLRTFSAAPDALLADLFTASWSLLGAEARQVLLTMLIFPAGVEGEVLAEVAGLDGTAFLHAVRQLNELALLETELGGTSGQARRAIHPLTRAFVTAQAQSHATFLDAARDRWLAWATRFASSFGYTIDNVARLAQLDAEETTLFAAMVWAFEHARDREAVIIAKGIEFYYYTRARWQRKLALHRIYIAAARRLGDVEEEILALTMHIQLLSRQGDHASGETELPRLRELMAGRTLSGAAFFHVQHALGLYWLARAQPAEAEREWRTVLDQLETQELPDHMPMGARHWLGIALERQGRAGEARACFDEALNHARQRGYDRMVARNQLHLALLDLADGELIDAERRLLAARDTTSSGDLEQRARISLALARLHRQRGNDQAASDELLTAIDLFERTDLTADLAAAQAAYAEMMEHVEL